MQKVYADKTLGYSDKEKFDVPEKYIQSCPPVKEKMPETYMMREDDFFN
jgi:penicillin-binding protein 1A